MPDCLFCGIASGEGDVHKLYEDDGSAAFLDINPVSRGHALVIPKEHAATITDIDTDDLGAVADTAKKVAEEVDASLDPDGINLLQSNGEAAGQEIGHFHLHVIPRYEDEGVAFSFQYDDLEDAEVVVGAVRDVL